MELRKIAEIDACPACGHNWLVFCNTGNQKAWAHYMNRDAETPLEFAEPYCGRKHKLMAMAGVTDCHGRRET